MLSSGAEPVEPAAAARRRDERRVRLAHALRLARRAGRVEHHRHVVGAALRDLRLVPAGIRAVELAADLLQPREARHALVVAQAARIVVVDVLERGDLRHGLQHLVDLLLVLDDRVGDLRVVQHEHEVRGGRVLVHRHRDAAQRLRRAHRPVQARPVVADDRQVHAAPEALRGESARERAHLVGHLAPRPRLPDAEVLLPRGRMVRAHLRLMQQEPRKRVELFLHLHLSLSRAALSWRAPFAKSGARVPRAGVGSSLPRRPGASRAPVAVLISYT